MVRSESDTSVLQWRRISTNGSALLETSRTSRFGNTVMEARVVSLLPVMYSSLNDGSVAVFVSSSDRDEMAL